MSSRDKDWISEAEALNDLFDAEDDFPDTDGYGVFAGLPPRVTLTSIRRECAAMLNRKTAAVTISRERTKALYEAAKAAKTGTTCTCPGCGRSFTKKSYQQAFCSNKGRGNCKDTFWNRASDERMERAKQFSVGG